MARYGPASQDRIRTWFEEEDLVYAPPADVVSNTRLALELGEGARAEGVHRAYHDRVMDAYWAEGRDLSLQPVLEELAREAGMSDVGISRALDDRLVARRRRLDGPRAIGRRDRRAGIRVRLEGARRRRAAARTARAGLAAGARDGRVRLEKTESRAKHGTAFGEFRFKLEHLADDGCAADDRKDDDEDDQPAYESFTSQHGAGYAPASG